MILDQAFDVGRLLRLTPEAIEVNRPYPGGGFG